MNKYKVEDQFGETLMNSVLRNIHLHAFDNSKMLKFLSNTTQMRIIEEMMIREIPAG